MSHRQFLIGIYFTKNTSALTYTKPIISYERFISTVKKFIDLQTTIIEKSVWFGKKIEPYDPHFNALNNPSAIKPYVAKLRLTDLTHVFLLGDLHGDVQALARVLYKLYQEGILDNDLTIRSENVYFLFLGDLVDRGLHGAEVMTLLFSWRLKTLNR